MSTRDEPPAAQLHPDVEALLEMVAAGVESGARVPLPRLTPEQARADFDASSPLLDVAVAALPHEAALRLPMRDGERIAARLYALHRPDPAAPLPVTLALHGGGFVVGSLDSHESLWRDLAVRSGAAVLAVAYRLAPEHRFPTAFEDACDALAWIGREGRNAGLDPGRVALFGDSAGGTLAAGLALAARDTPGLPRPCLQVLAYPGLAARQDSNSYRRFGRGYLLEAETVAWFFAQYLRDEADRRDWRFAPLEAADLAGTAPALIVLPACDPLLDEGRAYGERLRAAGVSVTSRIVPGMVHEFLRMGNVVEDALVVRAEIADALAAAFRQRPAFRQPALGQQSASADA
ncbi:alpha/beta hydrolase [Methylobacterium aquaticum]|uniref:Esterase n=1 Tax=Methylobacterium aquaticum TaxID=270351 RepID=A0A0J6T1Z6_9HYPH|nr:alpha/beta hydrolase [Methylobacterium aquaticum]KMO41470.1 esterase [Methylobacterium aquaticum]